MPEGEPQPKPQPEDSLRDDFNTAIQQERVNKSEDKGASWGIDASVEGQQKSDEEKNPSS